MAVSTLLYGLVGQAVFFGSLHFVWRAHATRWNRLARAYASDRSEQVTARRRLQTLILVGGGIAFNSYKGIVTVGATRDGIALNLLPPFSFLHPSLLIPYEDLRVRPTSWYVNASSFKCSFAAVDDVEFVIDDDLHAWIASHAARVPLSADA